MGTKSTMDRYHLEAFEMMRSGQKLTADALLARIGGGSKTTAVNALQSFWADYVPTRLKGAVLEPAPSHLDEALRGLWTLALDAARQATRDHLSTELAALATDRRALDLATSALTREKELFEAERHLAASQLAHARETITALDQEVATLRAAEAAIRTSLSGAQTTLSTLTTEAERLRDQLRTQMTQSATERAELRATHHAQHTDLKNAYVELDRKLRLEADAANAKLSTERDKHRAELAALKLRLERTEKRLDKEQASVKSLTAALSKRTPKTRATAAKRPSK